jgi:hypothetical protein
LGYAVFAVTGGVVVVVVGADGWVVVVVAGGCVVVVVVGADGWVVVVEVPPPDETTGGTDGAVATGGGVVVVGGCVVVVVVGFFGAFRTGFFAYEGFQRSEKLLIWPLFQPSNCVTAVLEFESVDPCAKLEAEASMLIMATRTQEETASVTILGNRCEVLPLIICLNVPLLMGTNSQTQITRQPTQSQQTIKSVHHYQ